MGNHPLAVAQMLLAHDFQLGPVQEFAIVGDPADTETRRVLRALQRGFRPRKVVALTGGPVAADADTLALLANRDARGGVTTYICENFTCKEPLVGAAAVESALDS
jgi:uncharacterized protein YyaL (SSP411 family)